MSEKIYEIDNEEFERIDMMENRHKLCAYCNNEFSLPYMVDLSQYAYKMSNPMVNGKKLLKKFGDTLWFCSWGCLSKFRRTYSSKQSNTLRKR